MKKRRENRSVTAGPEGGSVRHTGSYGRGTVGAYSEKRHKISRCTADGGTDPVRDRRKHRRHHRGFPESAECAYRYRARESDADFRHRRAVPKDLEQQEGSPDSPHVLRVGLRDLPGGFAACPDGRGAHRASRRKMLPDPQGIAHPRNASGLAGFPQGSF